MEDAAGNELQVDTETSDDTSPRPKSLMEVSLHVSLEQLDKRKAELQASVDAAQEELNVLTNKSVELEQTCTSRVRSLELLRNPTAVEDLHAELAGGRERLVKLVEAKKAARAEMAAEEQRQREAVAAKEYRRESLKTQYAQLVQLTAGLVHLEEEFESDLTSAARAFDEASGRLGGAVTRDEKLHQIAQATLHTTDREEEIRRQLAEKLTEGAKTIALAERLEAVEVALCTAISETAADTTRKVKSEDALRLCRQLSALTHGFKVLRGALSDAAVLDSRILDLQSELGKLEDTQGTGSYLQVRRSSFQPVDLLGD